ncbi:MAG: AEC family transporter, partial [Pseudomonadota bacterium]
EIKISDLSIFAVVWALSFIIMNISYFSCALIYKGKTQNLMASGLPCGNTGYFGIPIAFALFDSTLFGVYLLASISSTMFQITVSYYILALGQFDWKEAVKKLLSLPPLYGAVIGLFLTFVNIPLPDMVSQTVDTMKGAFTVLGMMIIGLTLSGFQQIKLDVKFLTLAMLIRFMIWPALTFAVIALDRVFFGGVLEPLVPILMLFSVLPIGADFAIYAANMNMYPQRAATAVLISTVVAAFVIPLAYTLWG